MQGTELLGLKTFIGVIDPKVSGFGVTFGATQLLPASRGCNHWESGAALLSPSNWMDNSSGQFEALRDRS